MYIYWKALFVFGLLFFGLSCLTDFYRSHNVSKPEQIFVRHEEPPAPVVTVYPSATFETIFLRTVALVLTFVLAAIGIKICIRKISMSFNQNWLNIVEMPKHKNLSKKAEITEVEKEAAVEKETPSVKSDTSSEKSTKHRYKKEKLSRSKSSKHLEKYCAKLQEKITELKVSSSHELRNLSDKVHVMSKEKQQLNMALQLALKENRAAKYELEDVLRERTELIKKLESATIEVKSNTKSKKTILTKLEEAVTNMERLKSKFDQVSRDKELLEEKVKYLETEYNQLKQQAYVYNDHNEMSNNDDKEHAVDRQDCGDFQLDFVTNDKMDDFDITQSENDMRKVQEKLMNLEKSLEKLKMTDANNFGPWGNYLLEEEEMAPEHEQEAIIPKIKPSLHSICTESECQLEHQHCSKPECLLQFSKYDEEGEEQDDEITDALMNAKSVHHAQSETLNFPSFDFEDVFQRSKSCENCDDRLSIITEQTSPTPSELEDEYDDDWEEQSEYGKSNKVSSHPLFLQFVANNLVQEI